MTQLEWLENIEAQHKDFETLVYEDYKAKYSEEKRRILFRLIRIFNQPNAESNS